jgi:hypothetical protein
MFTSGLRAALRSCGFTLALFLAACGGGGGSMPSSSNAAPTSNCSDCGTMFVAITDADGDFLSYSVDVTSLKLKKANGTLVETLPATTRIDFAQLVDLTEFFTAATILADRSASHDHDFTGTA